MSTIGIRDYPHACQLAQALCQHAGLPFPLNISLLLDQITTHKIYDVSSKTYNSTFAAGPQEALNPRHAWTVYNQPLDTYLIVWNPARPQAAIRYSVAHELGHILLGHQRA